MRRSSRSTRSAYLNLRKKSYSRKNIGVYIHVPFCVSKCGYCDFYSVAKDDTLAKTYVKALLRQFKEYHDLLGGLVADTVYVGGGTPSCIDTKLMKKIMSMLRRSIKVDKHAEITIEVNPATVDYQSLRAYRSMGFNRVSIGAQSFYDNELAALTRIHKAADIVKAVNDARTAKFENINLDLMFGIPEQTLDTFEISINEAIKLAVEHISIYGLKVEKDTPFDIIPGIKELVADDDLQCDMYLSACERLQGSAYNQYEISNFSKDGRNCMHNMKYWHGNEYIGFGPAAHSFINNRRFGHVREIYDYNAGLLRNKNDIVEESEVLTTSGRYSEYIMLRLRLTGGIDLELIRKGFGIPTEGIEEILMKYEYTGHALKMGTKWRLTPKGFLISNKIISDILDGNTEPSKI